jgi:hypothetical protein
MEIDKLVLKKIEYSIKYHADVSVTLNTAYVPEISSSKYADIIGLPHKKIKEWCIKGALTCRRLDNNGNEIFDWRINSKLGRWYIDPSKRIGEF